MERMNFEREMFLVEVARGAVGSVDASMTDHLPEMYKEAIQMVFSENVLTFTIVITKNRDKPYS